MHRKVLTSFVERGIYARWRAGTMATHKYRCGIVPIGEAQNEKFQRPSRIAIKTQQNWVFERILRSTPYRQNVTSHFVEDIRFASKENPRIFCDGSVWLTAVWSGSASCWAVLRRQTMSGAGAFASVRLQKCTIRRHSRSQPSDQLRELCHGWFAFGKMRVVGTTL